MSEGIFAYNLGASYLAEAVFVFGNLPALGTYNLEPLKASLDITQIKVLEPNFFFFLIFLYKRASKLV